jgi:hypothetical protein
MSQYLKEEKAKKEAAEEKAKLEGTEVPKPTMHDAKLEKAVAAAYDRDYPGNKILKVVLGGWSDDFEKDAFGRITGISGPLSARGSGSMETTEILCSKAEAGASAPIASTKKKRK